MIVDVTDGERISLLVDSVHAQFDQVDILVDNAYSSSETFDVGVFEITDEL